MPPVPRKCFFIIKRKNQMRERRPRPIYAAQIKSMHSHSSCLDIHSKVESLFLEKYFRYNLIDYFQDAFLTISPEILRKKSKHKFLRQVLSQTFVVNAAFGVAEMAGRINSFYAARSDSISSGQLDHCFKYLFSNSKRSALVQGQLVIVEVKIKAEVEKIQSAPQSFFRELNQYLQDNPDLKSEEPQLYNKIHHFSKDSVNFFMIYFGDVNFQAFNLRQYKVPRVRFFNREVELKVYVFYVSRLCMIDFFRKSNKIQNLQHINEIMINLYELKRDRARQRKKMKESTKFEEGLEKGGWGMVERVKWAGVLIMGAVALGAVIRYFS